MDYLISDAVTSPPEVSDDAFSEKLVLMPNTFFVSDHAQAYPLKSHKVNRAFENASFSMVFKLFGLKLGGRSISEFFEHHDVFHE